jgi:predicted DNA-binding transcriptional regulator YafY
MVIAWCELRQAFRHFRTDRIAEMTVREERYPARRAELLRRWQKEQKEEQDAAEQRASERLDAPQPVTVQ